MPDSEQPKEISPEMMEKFGRAFPNRRSFGVMPEPDEAEVTNERLDAIEEKIDALSAKLERIFGNSILLKGQFIDL